MLVRLAGIRTALDQGATQEAEREDLKAVLSALVDLQIGRQRSNVWTSFVLREIAEQGPAFSLLFDELWAPGGELITDLIGRSTGETLGSTKARLQALLLVSSLSAFSLARPIALKFLGWPDLTAAGVADIKAALAQQVDELAAATRQPDLRTE